MRSDADSWDITTGVGSTALFVAAARALAARRPDPPAVDDFAEMFCRAAGPDWQSLFDHPDRMPEHPLCAPGFGIAFQDFQSARTRYFDDYLRAAADAGIRQVVIVAAGLDSRAFRLPWPDRTVVYELDRPPVLQFKREVLTEHEAAPRAERREVAVDLRRDWPEALRRSGFDPEAASAWLVEGLLLYLTAAAQDRLFDAIDALAAPGSRVGIEQMDTLPPDVYAAMTAENASDEATEGQTEWARLIYNEPRNEVAQWFEEHGWEAERMRLTDYLATLGRSPLPAGPGPTGFTPELITFVTANCPR